MQILFQLKANDSIEYEHSDRARETLKAEFGEDALESALVALKADVGARRGATALCLAARLGNTKTVKYSAHMMIE